jgi:hypothetical protein
MRRAPKAFLLVLCFSAAYVGASAQGLSKASMPEGGAKVEAVGSLVSLLKDARSVTIPRANITERLGSVRAEGCVLRYNVAVEKESPNYYPGEGQQTPGSDYWRMDREFKVNLADLDAARVRVWNPPGSKNDTRLMFRTAGGKEAIRESWVQNSRLGARPMKRWRSFGSVPLKGKAAPEGVAEAFRRAVEACRAAAL